MGCLVCEQVIVTDNLLTDSDLEALMAFCRPGEGMDFIVNTYQKYKGVKVIYVADATDMLARIHEDLRAGRGCTIPCNTKKEADEIYNILRKHIPEDRLRLYTGEAGQVPHDLDRDWEGCAVVPIALDPVSRPVDLVRGLEGGDAGDEGQDEDADDHGEQTDEGGGGTHTA